MKCKELTAIICNYNNATYLPKALDSVMNQTLLPEHVVILDDASTDNSTQIIDIIKVKYSNTVKVVINKANEGMVGSFNKAVELAATDYVCKLDSDDFLESNYFEKTVPLFKSSQNTAIVYTDLQFVGERAKIAYYTSNEDYWSDSARYTLHFPEFETQGLMNLINSNFIHNSSVCRREGVAKAGGYRSSNSRAVDHDLFIRILQSGYTAKHANGTLLYYRQHSRLQQNVKEKKSSISLQEEEVRVMEDKLNKLNEKLKTIKSSRFYKLWRTFNSIKDKMPV